MDQKQKLRPARVRDSVASILAAACLVGGLGAVEADAAQKPTPTPTASSSTKSKAGSARKARDAADKADQLKQAVAEQSAKVAAARKVLEESTKAAAAALEAYAVAVQTQELAREEQVRQQTSLTQANRVLSEQRVVLGKWARKAYAEGGLTSDPTLATLLGGSADDVTAAHRWLSIAGHQRGNEVEAFEKALGEQERVARNAERANLAAQNSLTAAEAAKKTRDAAVKVQQDSLAAMQAELLRTQNAAAIAQAEASRLAAARAWASEQARLAAQAQQLAQAHNGYVDNRVTGQVGDCQGSDLTSYPNGAIPISALCPLWGAPGHHLRADAAFAFNKLSDAYARTFGRPICVTDSYRDYATQVALKATKPDLAATPGTSNHGWGTALDLCGGVQSFGTVEHAWMEINAPAYGWFLPGWAHSGGSKPEPWHFEFSG